MIEREEFKELIVDLTKTLKMQTIYFMSYRFSGLRDTSDIIDIVLSSYLSAMFSYIDEISKENENIHKTMTEFMNKMKKFIGSQYPIESIEMYKE